jgi:hypothetical protein
MLIRTDDEVFGLLDRQTHRRFIKTHTPLDGVPLRDDVDYIALIRHPLDVALSNADHFENERAERVIELRTRVAGAPNMPGLDLPFDDLAGYLRWFIDNDLPPTGSGPYGLADYGEQVRTYWDARGAPNVHLFHYADLWRDRDGEMRRVASALDVPIDEGRWPAFVEAAGLESMRSRADDTAPEAHLGLWHDPRAFFRSGGSRDWASVMSPDDLAHFEERLYKLAGEATGWVLDGRASLGPS